MRLWEIFLSKSARRRREAAQHAKPARVRAVHIKGPHHPTNYHYYHHSDRASTHTRRLSHLDELVHAHETNPVVPASWPRSRSRRSTSSIGPSRSMRSRDRSRSRSRTGRQNLSLTVSVNSPHKQRYVKDRSSLHEPKTRLPQNCFVCGAAHPGLVCGGCATSYRDHNNIDATHYSKLDVALLSAVCDDHGYELLEELVFRAFSSVKAAKATFWSDGNRLDTELLLKVYEILERCTSTNPMRGILRGAQQALFVRECAPIDENDMLYILALLKCPVFTKCSMFTTLTGPLQSLARYASLRSRARVLIEQCAGLVSHHPQLLNSATVVENLKQWQQNEFADFVSLLTSHISQRLMFLHHCYAARIKSIDPSQCVQTNGDVLVRAVTLRALGGSSIQASLPSTSDTILPDCYANDWRVSALSKLVAAFYKVNTQRGDEKVDNTVFVNVVVDHIFLGRDFDRWLTNGGRLNPFARTGHYFCNFPFMISTVSKALLIRHAAKRNSEKRASSEAANQAATTRLSFAHARMALKGGLRLKLNVRREFVVEDSLTLLTKSCAELSRPLKIAFASEEGIDAGGLRKEWILLLCQTLFNPANNFFTQEEEATGCWFADLAEPEIFELSGMVLAIALLNSILVDTGLPQMAFKLLTGEKITWIDAQYVWPAIARSVHAVTMYDGDDLEAVFGLNFTGPDGQLLCPNGEAMSVNQENKHQWSSLVLQSLLGNSIESQEKFRSGFYRLAGQAGTTLLNSKDLMLLITGDTKPLDVQTLKCSAKYRKGTCAVDRGIAWFWELFEEFSTENQAKLLRFITGTDRVPAAGADTLQLCLKYSPCEKDKLPTARTCFNQITIYGYCSKAALCSKLCLAMSECEGFLLK